MNSQNLLLFSILIVLCVIAAMIAVFGLTAVGWMRHLDVMLDSQM